MVLSFMPSNNTNLMAPAAASLIQQKDSIKDAFLLKPSPLPFTSSSHVTHTVLKTLKDFVGHENHTVYGADKIGSFRICVLRVLVFI